ncbi:MAG: AmmeMemoRadiSam system protein B [Candidatus Kerfeldbacteria bacterium]|nr:AmmeMemoRadiSam system protein B [Candidatus Kerfeldbacteria bacterium]
MQRSRWRILAAVGGLLVTSALARYVLFSPRVNAKIRTVHPIIPGGLDQAFAAAQGTPALRGQVLGVTVNHHLLAASLVAQMINLAATQHPSTILLLSPNHFLVGNGWMITSNQDWDTDRGTLKADHGFVKWLVKNDNVRLDESPFANEHGIYNLLPFLAKKMPNVKIVPIIFKDGMPDQFVDAFVTKASAHLPKDTLIIASLDFSHYHNKAIADQHDAETIGVIQHFNLAQIHGLDIDSPPALRALLELMRLRGAHSFQIVDHQNSADITGKLDTPETTSYINGVFLK